MSPCGRHGDDPFIIARDATSREHPDFGEGQGDMRAEGTLTICLGASRAVPATAARALMIHTGGCRAAASLCPGLPGLFPLQVCRPCSRCRL